MKSNYHERRANQLDAFERLAEKNESLSTQQYERAREIGSHIPMGQPILVGHHSEKRHRRDIAKIDNAMSKSVEASAKADYYKQRAETLLNGTAISSDDPNAIDKLEEKLEKLKARQELYKAINRAVKKKATDESKIAALKELGLKEDTAAKMLIPDRCHGAGIASYTLTNNNAVIRNTALRIEFLKKTAAIETTEEIINGVTLKINSEDNRVQMFFPGKPAPEVIKQCKSRGFHYSFSIGCWQRQISNQAIWGAKDILNSLTV